MNLPNSWGFDIILWIAVAYGAIALIMFGGNVSPAATLSNPFATWAPLALPPTTPFNAVAFCATCCASFGSGFCSSGAAPLGAAAPGASAPAAWARSR